MRRPALLALALLALLPACGRAPGGPAPRQIRLVGAAAGLPFSAAAAETVARADSKAIAPLVRAGGTGTGIARFCRGLGAAYPDLVLATRPPDAAELARCQASGVAHVATVPLGWTALVLATRPDTQLTGLSRTALWRALGSTLPSWAAADPRLPALPVLIDGPSPRAGIADGLFDRLLAPGCTAVRPLADCQRLVLRTDGVYRAHGADPALAIQAALAAPGAVAIIPWAEAVRQGSAVKLLALDGVTPSVDTIADGRYPARMPLLLLVKAAAAPSVPAMPALLRAFAAGLRPGGGFATLGLVPLPPATAARSAAMLEVIAAGPVKRPSPDQ